MLDLFVAHLQQRFLRGVLCTPGLVLRTPVWRPANPLVTSHAQARPALRVRRLPSPAILVTIFWRASSLFPTSQLVAPPAGISVTRSPIEVSATATQLIIIFTASIACLGASRFSAPPPTAGTFAQHFDAPPTGDFVRSISTCPRQAGGVLAHPRLSWDAFARRPTQVRPARPRIISRLPAGVPHPRLYPTR